MDPLRMLDSVTVANLPDGADAYAGYVDGDFRTWPELQSWFAGKAHLLSIAVFAADDAECLDIENGDATPGQAPAWVRRQHGRGIRRPVLYANAATMPDVIDALAAAGLPRSAYRLWTAHYDSGHGAHICGPHTCAWPGLTACDGTQWRDNAPGSGSSKVDESILRPDFFGPVTPARPATYLEEPVLLKQGQGAVTPVALPNDVKRHRFATSGKADVRIDFLDVSAKSVNLTVGYDNSPDGAANPAGCRAVIIHRVDAGDNDVSYCPVT